MNAQKYYADMNIHEKIYTEPNQKAEVIKHIS